MEGFSGKPFVVAVNISKGGIPKTSIDVGVVRAEGIVGDGHNHEKHRTPLQAVCLQDVEKLEEISAEGFKVSAGATGENLTVKNLNVNNLSIGMILNFSGGVILELTKVRKPCYVLDAIDPKLKDVIVGRCGLYAKVLREGDVRAGETITIVSPALNPSLYGLVLSGGQSRRMGKDKSILHYHGKSQVEHCVELLSHFCQKVFVSNRKEQSRLLEHKKFPQIHDSYHDIGPLGGILSAIEKFPSAAWFVLACDLPYVRRETIEELIKHRNPKKMMTGYAIVDGDFPEPLCAIYEPKIGEPLQQSLARGNLCMVEVLENCDCCILKQNHRLALANVNTKKESSWAAAFLKNKPSQLLVKRCNNFDRIKT